MANNGSVRGFERRRYPILVPTPSGNFGVKFPSEDRRSNKLIAFNKAAKQKAIAARNAAARIIGKVGLQWGRIELSSLTGGRILAYMQAAALTKPHGFVPGADATYKHLHATKGYRFVPA